MPRSVSAPSTLSRRPGPIAAGLLLLLALAGAPPAHASLTVDASNSSEANPYTINGEVSGTVTVAADGWLNIVDGALIHNSSTGVEVDGGTVNISGGSISGSTDGVYAEGGTVNISGGTLSGSTAGVHLDPLSHGTVNISGGSISGLPYGVARFAGTVNIFGCLRLQNGTLKGTLADGHAINTFTTGITAANLQNLSTCDLSAPTTTPSATNADTTSYAAGTWTHQSVNVVLSTTDLGGSGTKEILYSATGADQILSTAVPGGTASFTIAKEGTTTIRFHADDNAGNVEPDQTFVVKIDRTAPQTTASLNGPAGTNGWYVGPVPVSLSATDAGSGVASTVYRVDGGAWQTYAGSPFSVSRDGSHTVDFYSTDNAGGTEGSQSVSVNIDQSAPSLTLPSSPVTATATSIAGALVNFSLNASDSGSGLAANSPTATPASGSLVPLGTTLVNVAATDNAGNTAKASFPVSVTYAWSGPLQPINADGSSVFKAGRTVPVKFALAGPSAGITTAVATLSYQWVGSSSAPVNEADSTSAATTGNQFHYDSTSGQYLYNWDTRGLAAGTYQLRIDLGDGVLRTVTVGLR